MGQWPASLSLSFFLSLAVRRRDLRPRGWLLSNRKTHHMFALKRFLGAGQMTPNNMIYGDTARYPLYINAYVRAIRYWPKITRINEKRLPYKAYLLLLHLEEQGKNNWVTKIAQLCLDLVLGTYGRTREFRKLICFRQRLGDNRWQDRKSRINASDRFNFYRQFKTNHVQAVYLSVDINKYIRNSLIKFRFGVSPIVVHSLRYKTHAYTDTIWPVENEAHFTLCCSALKDLRQRLIPDKFYSQPSSFRLVLLLSTGETVWPSGKA